MRRLNELGFDVDEVELIDAGGTANKLRLRTRVAEPGHHRRLLFTRTGLVAQENQARRLLNDIASFRSHLERAAGRPVPEAVAANRWLSEVYDPAVDAIPDHLRDRLDEVEIFHEILEHRWFLSEQAGRDIGTTAARDGLLRPGPAEGARRPDHHRRGAPASPARTRAAGPVRRHPRGSAVDPGPRTGRGRRRRRGGHERIGAGTRNGVSRPGRTSCAIATAVAESTSGSA